MTTILAVDDSATMRKCLEITFAGSEFELVTVDNAQAALEKVKTVSPALVIADVSLPPNDGYELCSTIKLAAPNMPVLMLSSKQHPFDPSRGAQADGHIDKPFDTQVLQDKARALVRTDATGDTDTPPARGDAKPVAMPDRAAPGKIPAPRRKRPTPAMMAKPEITTKPQPPGANIRRTVPFAMPGAAKRAELGDRGVTGVTKPIGPRELAASQALGQGVQRGLGAPRPGMNPAIARQVQPGHLQQGHGSAVPDRPMEKRTPTEPQPTQARPKPVMSDTLPGVTEGTAPPVAKQPVPTATVESVAEPSPPTPLPPAVSGQPSVAVAVETATDLAGKLEGLGLTRPQIEGVMALSRDLIEQVVWEVVPVLAETLIKEEIRRLTKE